MYIVFEGIDNTGKTTQIPLVKNELDSELRNLVPADVITIKEPEIPAQNLETNTPNLELIFKYSIQRLKLQDTIRKHNNLNNIILSDRSYLSTIAYQGLNYKHIGLIEEINRNMISPDYVILFTGKPETPFLDMIQQKYLDLAKSIEAKGVGIIDTREKSIAETTEILANKIYDWWNGFYK